MISTYPRGRVRELYETNIPSVSSGRSTGKENDAKAMSAALMLSPHRYNRPSERIFSINLRARDIAAFAVSAVLRRAAESKGGGANNVSLTAGCDLSSDSGCLVHGGGTVTLDAAPRLLDERHMSPKNPSHDKKKKM